MDALDQNLTAEQLSSTEFWQEFAEPGFSFSTEAKNISVDAFMPDSELLEKAKKSFEHQGYLHFKNVLDLEFEKYISMLKKLYDAGLPAVFGFIYDEFWETQAKLKSIAEVFLGKGVKILPTQWMWYVDAVGESKILDSKDRELKTRSMFSGFYQPHRDKGYRALYPDGKPKILSFWIPYSEANPENSCISIVPADRDPTYKTPEENEWKFRRADIRSLPAKPGDLLFWNEAVLHWASRPALDSLYDLKPRVSGGFEIIAAEFDGPCHPVFELDYIPDFKTKLEIIATQFRLYITEEGFPPMFLDFIRANDGIIKTGKEVFEL